MISKNAKTILFASLIVAMILPFSMMESVDAVCTTTDCGKEDDLRIWADYETIGFWAPTTHHLSDNQGVYVSKGHSGGNYVIVKSTESGFVFPSFLIKSNSVEPKTASYTVSYIFYDQKLGTTYKDTRTYSNVVFDSYLDGETERFPVIRGGVDKNDIFVMTLTVHSIS